MALRDPWVDQQETARLRAIEEMVVGRPATFVPIPPMSTTPKDHSVHFSSASNEWQTPPWLFARLNSEFSFDFDAAASDANHLCPKYYTAEQDALKQQWGRDGTACWINPPYGRIGPRFLSYGAEQCRLYPHLTVVFLVPARPDTAVWQDHCSRGEVRFLRGRIGFVNPSLPSYRADGDFKVSPAPFPSAIVVFGAKARAGQTFYVDYRQPKVKRARRS